MKIVAVTACPTGIAHTYMAAARLEKIAKSHGHEIKVETQGAIGIECRADDDRAAFWLAPLNDLATARRVAAERALLAALDGSCKTPIAAFAALEGITLTLRALIVRPDGTQHFTATRSGNWDDAESMGQEIGAELRRRAGPGYFDLPMPAGPSR